MLIPKTNNCEQQTWLGIDYGILISAHYNLGSIILSCRKTYLDLDFVKIFSEKELSLCH